MSKLSKFIKALKIIVKKPYVLNTIIEADSALKEEVIKLESSFINGLPLVDFIELFPDFNETISPYSSLYGGSLITDIGLLKALSRKIDNCTYFEIGTWRGESVSNVAEHADKCYTLNLSNNALSNLGYNTEYLNQQGLYSKNLKNVTHLRGNSFDFDFSSYYGKCDLVFIDGDHRYDSVVNDTEIAFKLLKDENSIIIWHDYSRDLKNIRWDVLKGIIDGTPQDKRSKLYGVSNTLCAMYCEKPLNTINPLSITPSKSFSMKLSAQKL